MENDVAGNDVLHFFKSGQNLRTAIAVEDCLRIPFC